MYAVAYRNTERSIRARNFLAITEERKDRLRLQRELYEAKIIEDQRIAELRRVTAERAEAIAAELRAQGGLPFRHTYREIERRACKLFNVRRSEIASDRRNKEIVFVRHFIAYWTVRLTSLSLPQIGRLMGGRDHTTILHGRHKYPVRRELMGRYLRPAR